MQNSSGLPQERLWVKSRGIIFLYIKEKFYLFPLKFRRDHTIVTGLNYRSLSIIRDLVRRKQQIVVIEKDGHNTLHRIL